MNFSPDITTGTAVVLSLLAAFMWGSWFISLKYLGDYPIDGFYVTLFTTALVFVWGVALAVDGSALFDNIRSVWIADPSRIWVTLLCGMLYVTGIRLSLTSMQVIGFSLSQPIQASFNILVGTLISGVVGGIPAGVNPAGIAAASLLLVGAVLLSVQAGRLRSRELALSDPAAGGLRFTSADLLRATGLLVLSSLLLQTYTFSLSYGLRTITQPVGMAVLPFMALLATGAFIGAMITSGGVLTARRQWQRMWQAGWRIHRFGIFSGLFHYGGNIIHTFGTAALSPVVSWPLGVTMGLWTQLWGLVYGEFRGASRRTALLLAGGIALYLLGAYLVTAQVQ